MLLNSPSASGTPSRILLLEGTTMEATEAAWDFTANANNREELLDQRSLSGPAASKPYQFEVPLHTPALVGTAAGTSVLAVRTGARAVSPLTNRF